ncbi:GNAT family N-acetyltransferase [Hyphococcus sp.]|uniref:GNAT family N-acetyltransferase n=1 Tax=Hyphococcus sp. TaxID=2038636 RepID=UPI002087F890|nr:MAG: N-acetyltransferase [Marinicaulis sp.]
MAIDIKIRPIEFDDVAALFQMMQALADNQNERQFLTVDVERLRTTGFGDRPQWRGVFAIVENKPVGYATYTNDLHVWSGAPRIALDDIYVRPDFRSHGIGEKLMQAVFDEARKAGAYVSWSVQPGNYKAIAFYRRLGASVRITGKCGWRAPD